MTKPEFVIATIDDTAVAGAACAQVDRGHEEPDLRAGQAERVEQHGGERSDSEGGGGAERVRAGQEQEDSPAGALHRSPSNEYTAPHL